MRSGNCEKTGFLKDSSTFKTVGPDTTTVKEDQGKRDGPRTDRYVNEEVTQDSGPILSH